MKNPKQSRRSMIKSMFATLMATSAGIFGIAQANPRIQESVDSETKSKPIQKNPDREQSAQDQVPLFSGSVVHNGLVYIAGKGYHEEGDITRHTNEVLDLVEEELIRAGSSMDRVLKVNVYLDDLADYAAMNEAYRGRFGENPPVRTTVACKGGIPGSSLVEIDCIAALDDS